MDISGGLAMAETPEPATVNALLKEALLEAKLALGFYANTPYNQRAARALERIDILLIRCGEQVRLKLRQDTIKIDEG